MSTRRQRIAAIALALVASFALASCGTSFNAQTNQQYQAAVGANVREGAVQVYNALFVDNGDGTATFSGAILTSDEQSLVEATTASGTVAFTGPVEVSANTLLTLGSAGEIIVTGDAQAGGHLELTIRAASGESVTVNAPVVERTAMYDSVARSASANAGDESAAVDEDPADEDTDDAAE